MDKLTETIKEKIDLNYKSVREFAQAVDVPYTTILTALSKGFGGTAVEKVIKICTALNIDLMEYSSDLNYLHKNNELTFTLEEIEHIKKYRTLDEYGKDVVNTILEKELYRTNQQQAVEYTINPEIADMVRELPLYYMPVSAGSGNYLDTTDFELIQVADIAYASKADFAVRISGDSMEPRFSTGDIILVQEQSAVEPGELGIFILNGDSLFKVFGGDRLISLNKDYSDRLIGPDDSFYCKGKVLGAVIGV